jgi:putative ABC transport system permease protein
VTRQSILVGMASATEAIASHRLRSAFLLLGVGIGVLSVLAVAGYSEYANARLATILAQFGSNLVAVMPAPPLTRSARTGRVNTLTVDDANAIQEQVPNVMALSGVRSGSITAVAGRYSWNTQVVGVTAAYLTIRGLEPRSGRFFADADEQTAAPVAVLGANLVARLFPGVDPVGVDPVGQVVRLNGSEFYVIGVLGARGQTVNGDLDDIIYVPLTTSLRRLYGGTSLDRVEARVDSAADIGPSIVAMTRLLEQRHHLAGGAPDDFQIQNYQLLADRAAAATQALAGGLTAGAALALAIAGFGLMNIMLVSVAERTPEIGVRMAVGARSADVRAQFLVEAVTLCLGGAVLSAALGLIGAEVISQRFGVCAVPPLSAVFMACGISVAIGLAFGLYPAERAARLDPIVALRCE